MKLTELFIGAHGAMERGEFGMAAEAARHALVTYPDCLSAHRLMGESLLEQGLTVAAERHFRRTLEMDPVGVVPMLGMGVAAEDRGDLAGAYSWYLQAWEHNPRLTQVRDELLRLRVELGREARLHPSRAGLAAIHARAGQLDRAAEEWRAVLISDPRSPQARTALVEILWRMGDDASAEVVCGDLLWQNPLNARALLLLADIAQRRGNPIWSDYAGRYRTVDPEGEIAAVLLESREDADLSLFCLPDVLIPYFAFDASTLTATADDVVDHHADESAWLSLFGGAAEDVVVGPPASEWLGSETDAAVADAIIEDRVIAVADAGLVGAVAADELVTESTVSADVAGEPSVDEWASFLAAVSADAGAVELAGEDQEIADVAIEEPAPLDTVLAEVAGTGELRWDLIAEIVDATGEDVVVAEPAMVEEAAKVAKIAVDDHAVVAATDLHPDNSEVEAIAATASDESADVDLGISGDAMGAHEMRPQTDTLARGAVQMDDDAYADLWVLETLMADDFIRIDATVSEPIAQEITVKEEWLDAVTPDSLESFGLEAADVAVSVLVDEPIAEVQASVVSYDVLNHDQWSRGFSDDEVVAEDAEVVAAAEVQFEETPPIADLAPMSEVVVEHEEVVTEPVVAAPAEPVAPPTFEELSRELDALMASLGSVGSQPAVRQVHAPTSDWAPFTRELVAMPAVVEQLPEDAAAEIVPSRQPAFAGYTDLFAVAPAASLHASMTSRRTRELDRLIASLGTVSARRASRELHVKHDQPGAQLAAGDRLVDFRGQLLDEPASVAGIVDEVSQMISAGREEPYARRVLGEAYMRGGEYSLAAEQFRRAMLDRLGYGESVG